MHDRPHENDEIDRVCIVYLVKHRPCDVLLEETEGVCSIASQNGPIRGFAYYWSVYVPCMRLKDFTYHGRRAQQILIALYLNKLPDHKEFDHEEW